MSEELAMLEHFNKHFGKNASFFKRHYGYDLDDARTLRFYEMVEDIDPSSGYYLVTQVGGYNDGNYYTSYKKDEAGYFVCENANERGFPLSDRTISIGHLRVDYRATRFDTNKYRSTVILERFWVSEIEEIAKSNPEMAEEVTQLLNTKICELASIQNQRGYKSAWVYYQYNDQIENLSKIINGQILKSTKWLYSPTIHYNRFSPKLVNLSKSEVEELEHKHWSE